VPECSQVSLEFGLKNLKNTVVKDYKLHYIVKYNYNNQVCAIIFTDGKSFYELNNDGIILFKETSLKQLDDSKINEFYNFIDTMNKNVIVNELVKPDMYVMDIDIVEENINNNVKNDDIIVNDKNDNNENNETNDDIIDECNKLMEVYEREKERKKNILSTQKQLKKKEEELMKKKKENIQNKIIKVVGNYKTYMNIKSDMNKEEKMDSIKHVMSIFELQYAYFEKLTDEDKDLLKTVNDIDILNNDGFNEELVRIANGFDLEFKQNAKQVLFEHNWSELDEDVQNVKLNV
jgi:hypothetical protein